MACYYPNAAIRRDDGTIQILGHYRNGRGYRSSQNDAPNLELPCGQCTGCRLERSRQWAVRIMHEAKLHEDNSYLTLTYAPENLKEFNDWSLNYEDFQQFMKRLRERISPKKVRFYMCGEYGSKDMRPHFHACLFGLDFPDKKYWQKTGQGHVLYRSAFLESIWTKGFSTIGNLTFESAAYVARYVMKKVNGNAQDEHYLRVHPDTGEVIKLKPEFNQMSLKPGIGRKFYEKYRDDIYPDDCVVINGRRTRPPRYYDKIYSADSPLEFEEVQFKRLQKAAKYTEYQTTEFLEKKEIIKEASIKKLKRSL